MAREEIYTGLDIGSDNIRVVVAQRENTSLKLLSLAENRAEGINRGIISSIEDAVSSISSCLEQAERMAGIPIEHASIGINGPDIASQNIHGIVAISRANGEIREDDVSRALEAAQAMAHPTNYEVLHVLPRSFTVDNQSGIKDPVGMTGVRLEVDAEVIEAPVSQIKNLTKSIYRTGVDINDIVLGVLACSEAVLSKRQKELGVVLINIGASTTSILVFEDGDVLHSAVLPLGGSHITNDIAIGLRTSIDTAEIIKNNYGFCLPGEVNKREEIDLSEIVQGEQERVGKKYVAEIIEARLEEIFKLVDQELKSIDRSGKLPAGVIFAGGAVKIPGCIELAKEVFKLPASIGYPQNIESSIDKINDPAFATVAGLVLWGAQLNKVYHSGGKAKFSSINEVTGKMKKWLGSLVP